MISNCVGCGSNNSPATDKTHGEIYISRSSTSNNIFSDFLDAMESKKEVSFVITVNSYGRVSSTYRFVVDANGLSEIKHHWVGSVIVVV